MHAFVRICLLLAVCSAAAPAAAQRPDAAAAAPAPMPALLRPPAVPTPEPAAPLPLGRYATRGMIIGGAAGLVYGLAAGDDTFGLSPVIETAIGVGIGFYVGAAIDLVRSLR